MTSRINPFWDALRSLGLLPPAATPKRKGFPNTFFPGVDGMRAEVFDPAFGSFAMRSARVIRSLPIRNCVADGWTRGDW